VNKMANDMILNATTHSEQGRYVVRFHFTDAEGRIVPFMHEGTQLNGGYETEKDTMEIATQYIGKIREVLETYIDEPCLGPLARMVGAEHIMQRSLKPTHAYD
jgi:hypothetical protein